HAPDPAHAPAPEPSPHGPRPAEGAQEVKNRKGKKTGLIIAASVLLLALAYVGVAWFFADRVPADTTVAGVDVSGLARSDAVDRLATELDDVITSEITVTLGESESAIEIGRPSCRRRVEREGGVAATGEEEMRDGRVRGV